MAYTTAQLSAAITSSAVSLSLTNVVAPSAGSALPAVGAIPLSVGVPMLIDTEFLYVVAQPSTGVYQVRGRGSDGTAAAAHDILANCYASLVPTDFGLPQAGTVSTIDPSDDMAISLGQDQTVTPVGSNSVYNINKASAAALTLVAPNVGDNGVTVVFTSNTAFAHVITATSLIQDGASGVPHTTATFAAQKGASMTLVAENGFWNVQALQNVTIS